MKKIYLILVASMLMTTFAMREAGAWVYAVAPGIPGAQAFLNQTLMKYQHQSKLVKGFANASVYSSSVATQRGYQGYDKFVITVGTMAGAQVPAVTPDLGYYKQLADRLRKEGDIKIGVAWNAWAVNVGVKLPADFTISAKFGILKYSYADFDFDGINAGGMLNYQLV
jgi:hypothetical protein